jgi:hypothetical protein
LVLLINVYTRSSTKLEIKAKQFLPGSEGAWGERERVRGRGKMTQTLHAYMNKRILKRNHAGKLAMDMQKTEV